jgi:acyl carrier protein
VLDALPLSPIGKLDRRALPAPDYTAGSEAFQAPTTARERALCELFAQVLGVERVGVEDSFFDLGGHSLLAAVLVARLTKQLGTKLSLKAFMGHPTVRAIDKYLAPSHRLGREFQLLGMHRGIPVGCLVAHGPADREGGLLDAIEIPGDQQPVHRAIKEAGE